MITSFFIAIVVDLANVLFTFVPSFGAVVASFASGLNTVISYALWWEWLIPVQEAFGLVVLTIQFEIALSIFFFVKWLIERFTDLL